MNRKVGFIAIPIAITMLVFIVSISLDQSFLVDIINMLSNPFGSSLLYMFTIAFVGVLALGFLSGYVKTDTAGTYGVDDTRFTMELCSSVFYGSMIIFLIAHLVGHQGVAHATRKDVFSIAMISIIAMIILAISGIMLQHLGVMLHQHGHGHAHALQTSASATPTAVVPGAAGTATPKKKSWLLPILIFVILVLAFLGMMFPSTNPNGMNGVEDQPPIQNSQPDNRNQQPTNPAPPQRTVQPPAPSNPPNNNSQGQDKPLVLHH